MKLGNYLNKIPREIHFNFSLENKKNNFGNCRAQYWNIYSRVSVKITHFPRSCHITPKSFLNVHPNLYTREAANISGLIAFDYVEILTCHMFIVCNVTF